jgi:hypothetical protein
MNNVPNEPSNVVPDARPPPEVADTDDAQDRSAAAWATFHKMSGQAGHIEGEPDVQQPGGDYATQPEDADDEK